LQQSVGLAVGQEVLLVLVLLLRSVDFQILSSMVPQAEEVVVGPCSSGSQFHLPGETHSVPLVASLYSPQ
jgi:hypothetical protein